MQAPHIFDLSSLSGSKLTYLFAMGRTYSPMTDELSYLLRRSMEKSTFDKTPRSEFLPKGKLDQLITKESILAEFDLDELCDEDEVLVAFILDKAKSLFATTASASLKAAGPNSLYKAMALFYDHGFDDSNLPIKDRSHESTEAVSTKWLQHPFACMETESGVKKIRHRLWTGSTIYNFHEAQWKFIVPKFSTSEPNHDLGEHIVPFVSKHSSGEGAFGVVWKYEIHNDHINDSSNSVGENKRSLQALI
ncbi:hypothetical protein N0V83_005309 [Neocucurbitaria cava]|uniref:Uncharacterized protein n=1 Tax=Neocucurbitaria cava TaxID=798079 RepID=A0A9W8Y9I1_9PLEO|nr:hypothetical protein N0V83_005309 [Neocucurbitaria cava]